MALCNKCWEDAGIEMNSNVKVTEARKILGEMMDWSLFHEGVDEETPQTNLEGYSLSELLKANSIVDKINKKNMAKVGRSKIQMTMDDKLIAALYTAIHYKAEKNSKACYRNRYVAVFTPQMELKAKSAYDKGWDEAIKWKENGN